jgi:hypothetical protein
MTALTRQELDQINQVADQIMRVDGDRDHMSHSDLTCEQTQSIARFLRALARGLHALARDEELL